MFKSGLINAILKSKKSNKINLYPNIIPQLSLNIFKIQNISYSSSSSSQKWGKDYIKNSNKKLLENNDRDENVINISPSTIEIVKIKNQAIGEVLNPKLKQYKDIQVGSIIENKIQNNLGRIVKIVETSTVWDAIKVMNDKKVGATIVVDRNNRMSGIFSERDYLSKVDLRGLSPKETLVKDVMSSKVITVSGESGATKCLSIMSKRNIRHLPVISNKRLIGMLSIGDIVKYIITTQNNELNELKSDIEKD